jgi:hypothetical protein
MSSGALTPRAPPFTPRARHKTLPHADRDREPILPFFAEENNAGNQAVFLHISKFRIRDLSIGTLPALASVVHETTFRLHLAQGNAMTTTTTAKRTTDSSCRTPVLPRMTAPSAGSTTRIRRLLDSLMRSLAAPHF